jgi:hypothetical protein
MVSGYAVGAAILGASLHRPSDSTSLMTYETRLRCLLAMGAAVLVGECAHVARATFGHSWPVRHLTCIGGSTLSDFTTTGRVTVVSGVFVTNYTLPGWPVTQHSETNTTDTL